MKAECLERGRPSFPPLKDEFRESMNHVNNVVYMSTPSDRAAPEASINIGWLGCVCLRSYNEYILLIMKKDSVTPS